MSKRELLVAASSGKDVSVDSSRDGDSSAPASILELESGMELKGRVKSITDFGAFVDLGIAQDGLVHISELVPRRVAKVSDVVKVGDEARVWVKKVDKKRGRISLTMVKPVTRRFRELKPDTILQGTVTRIEPYGVFVDIGTRRDGLVHVSELAEGYIDAPNDVVSLGDKVQVRVLKVDRKARKVDLSMKEFIEAPKRAEPEPTQAAESQEATPTIMALAFQAAIEEDNKGEQRHDIEKMISDSLKR